MTEIHVVDHRIIVGLFIFLAIAVGFRTYICLHLSFSKENVQSEGHMLRNQAPDVCS